MRGLLLHLTANSRSKWWLLGLLLAALLRLSFAFTVRGFHGPDAIFQSKEIAHYMVYGRGLLPWEFTLDEDTGHGAARSILHPLVYVPVFALGLLGLPWHNVLDFTRLMDGLISFLALLCFLLFSRSLSPHRFALGLIFGFCVSHFHLLQIGNHSYSNVIYCIPLFLAMRDAFLGRVFRAGLGLGLASLLRFDACVYFAFFLLCFLPWKAWLRRSFLLPLLSGFSLTGIWLLAALDMLWYGKPYLSSIRSFVFNAFLGEGLKHNIQDGTYYLQELATPILAVLILILFHAAFLWRERRGGWPSSSLLLLRLCIFQILVLTVFSLNSNQQLRFLYPWLFFFSALQAELILAFMRHKVSSRLLALVQKLVVLGFLGSWFWANALAFQHARPWFELFADVQEAQTWVGEQDDVTGLLTQEVWAKAGGVTTFHSGAKLLFSPLAPDFLSNLREVEQINYAIVPHSRQSRDIDQALVQKGFHQVKVVSGRVLIWKKEA